MTSPPARSISMPSINAEHPPRLQEPGTAAASGEVKHDHRDRLSVEEQEQQLSRVAAAARALGNQASTAQSGELSSCLAAIDLSRSANRRLSLSIAISGVSASFADASSIFTFGATQRPADSLEAAVCIRPTFARELQRLSARPKPKSELDIVTNMFNIMATPSGLKRGREDDKDDVAQQQMNFGQRRIARARDNSQTYSFAAGNISENSINSTSVFQSIENSSPPRARSNALLVPQVDLTPCASDTEDVQHKGSGFAKIPNLSLRSRNAAQNQFSAAQSPAEPLDSSQAHMDDSQDTSMVTEDSQGDSAMDDFEMEDAPQMSQDATSSFTHTYAGASIAQATNLLQTSRRLPSPAVSEDDARLRGSSLGVENSGHMDMLHSAQKGIQAQRASSFGGSQNMGHVATGIPARGDAPQRKKRAYMGILKGCQKCRDRVPGHYMHLI